jgi:hypothetical protein
MRDCEASAPPRQWIQPCEPKTGDGHSNFSVNRPRAYGATCDCTMYVHQQACSGERKGLGFRTYSTRKMDIKPSRFSHQGSMHTVPRIILYAISRLLCCSRVRMVCMSYQTRSLPLPGCQSGTYVSNTMASIIPVAATSHYLQLRNRHDLSRHTYERIYSDQGDRACQNATYNCEVHKEG